MYHEIKQFSNSIEMFSALMLSFESAPVDADYCTRYSQAPEASGFALLGKPCCDCGSLKVHLLSGRTPLARYSRPERRVAGLNLPVTQNTQRGM